MDEIDGMRVVEAARGWLGTPYVHQACLKGKGCDCVGLVRGVFRELLGWSPRVDLDYSMSWGEISGKERLLATAREVLIEKPLTGKYDLGDIIVMRWRGSRVAKHTMIYSGGGRIIHAINDKYVEEIKPPKAYWKMAVAVFKLPGVK